MAAFEFPVVWRDANHQGLNGVVEIQSSDFPKGTSDNARVRDLMAIVNKKIAKGTSNKSVVPEVNCIMLHGVRVRSNSRLEYLVPELMGSSPRFVATTQLRLVKMRGIPMVVFVRTLAGKTATIECTSTDTVAYIKTRIEDKEGLSTEDQRLMFAGKPLQDNLTLSFYNVRNMNTLHLTGRILGGFTSGLAQSRMFADVSDGSIITAVEFSDRAPKWRICCKGLNIEGRCENRDCAAFRQMAIHRKNFELFNLIRDEDVRCPLCQWKMKPITCGLYDCSWRFEGLKAIGRMSLSSPWNEAQGYKYHWFDAHENKNSVEWASLLMVVKPRNDSVAAKLLPSTDSVGIRTDDVCTVCWSPFGSTSRKSTATIHCGHNVHGVCFDIWSKQCKKNNTLPSCPICRRTA